MEKRPIRCYVCRTVPEGKRLDLTRDGHVIVAGSYGERTSACSMSGGYLTHEPRR